MANQETLQSAWEIGLRDVHESDLATFYEHQCQPEANEMAAFPPRDHDAFVAHWRKIQANPAVTVQTIVVNGAVAGNVVMWPSGGLRCIGYWIGKEYWGQGIATHLTRMFLQINSMLPVHAFVARQNIASIRVLEKSKFLFSPEATKAMDPPADGIEEVVYVLNQ